MTGRSSVAHAIRTGKFGTSWVKKCVWSYLGPIVPQCACQKQTSVVLSGGTCIFPGLLRSFGMRFYGKWLVHSQNITSAQGSQVPWMRACRSSRWSLSWRDWLVLLARPEHWSGVNWDEAEVVHATHRLWPCHWLPCWGRSDVWRFRNDLPGILGRLMNPVWSEPLWASLSNPVSPPVFLTWVDSIAIRHII